MFDKIYIMFSRLANRYSDVFSCASDALAIKRVYQLLSQNDGSALNEWDLFCLGEFEISKGSIKLEDGLRRIEFRNGLDIKQAETLMENEKEKIA